jgi:hypothetical protein
MNGLSFNATGKIYSRDAGFVSGRVFNKVIQLVLELRHWKHRRILATNCRENDFSAHSLGALQMDAASESLDQVMRSAKANSDTRLREDIACLSTALGIECFEQLG